MEFSPVFRGGSRVSIGRLALTRRAGAVALAAALAAPVAGVVAFRQAPADPSPAVGDARVIAQGVVAIGPGDLVWQVSQASAEPPANAAAVDARTGFLLAGDGAMLVEDETGDDQVRLANGEATLTTAGDRQLRAALGPNATGYAAIELVPVGDATEGAGFVSAPFAGDGSRRDLDLVSDSLLAGETLELPAGAGPTAVLVTAGAVDISTAAGEVLPLAAGEALTAEGAMTATAGESGADLVAAVIGPAAPRLAEQAQAAPAGTPAAAVTVAPAASPQAVQAAGAADDEDGDGLTLAQEDDLNTDPVLADTDGDGLSDGDEVNVYATLPLVDDSDEDGVSDGDAVATGLIVAGGAAPAPAAAAADAAEPAPDAAATAAEEPAAATVEEPVAVEEAVVAEEPDPVVEEPAGQPGDSDGDFLPDVDETAIGTDPFNPDTDADGLLDGSEVFDLSLGPLNPDNDGDGVLDGDEINNGTDPNNPGSA